LPVNILCVNRFLLGFDVFSLLRVPQHVGVDFLSKG